MPKNRGPQEKVYVPFNGFKYGWRINSAKFKSIGNKFGILSAATENGVTYGANSPKPPVARKVDASGSVSSFCDPSKVTSLKKEGYEVNQGGSTRGIRLSGRSVTVYVPTPLGYKYAWNMIVGDVDEAVKIGVIKATGSENDLVWGSFPKPPRAYKKEKTGGFSTFIEPSQQAVAAAVQAGYTVEGIDPDWGAGATATP